MRSLRLFFSWISLFFGVFCLDTHKATDVSQERHYVSPRIIVSHPCTTGVSKALCSCSKNVDVTLQIGLRREILQLILNTNVQPHNVPVTIGTGNKTIAWKPPKSRQPVCMYHDLSKRASVAVNKDFRDVHLDGSFMSNGNTYVIKSLSRTQTRIKRSLGKRFYTATHVIDRINTEVAQFEVEASHIKSRHTRASKVYSSVEVLVVVDYYIFKRWKDYSNRLSDAQRKDDAISNIQYYFSHIVNGMDIRFQSIFSSDFGVSIKLKAFHIAETGSDSPWTYNNLEISNGEKYVEASLALTDFKSWLNQHRTEHQCDHGILFTGLNMYTQRLSGKDPKTSGQAYLGGMCGFERVSIIEDFSRMKSTTIAAHELGHSLNASHDDVNINGCDANSQFIMTAVIEEVMPGNYMNYYTFSDCSVWEIGTFVSSMRRSNNCLRNTAEVWNGSGWKNTIKELPGQRFDLDFQCAQITPPYGRFCGSTLDKDKICGGMFCNDPGAADPGCYIHSSIAAFDGTSCGNKKWCKRGKCESDEDAPPVDECFLGEYKGRFTNSQETCAEAVAASRATCYQNGDICCESCARVKDENKPGCEYGDRANGCHMGHCSLEQNLELCCGTCNYIRSTTTTTTMTTTTTTATTTTTTTITASTGIITARTPTPSSTLLPSTPTKPVVETLTPIQMTPIPSMGPPSGNANSLLTSLALLSICLFIQCLNIMRGSVCIFS